MGRRLLCSRPLEEHGRGDVAHVGLIPTRARRRDGGSGDGVGGKDPSFGMQQTASRESARAGQEGDGTRRRVDLVASRVPNVEGADGGAVPWETMHVLVLVMLHDVAHHGDSSRLTASSSKQVEVATVAELNGATVVAVPMRRSVEAIAPASNDAVFSPVHVEVQPAVVFRQ